MDDEGGRADGERKQVQAGLVEHGKHLSEQHVDAAVFILNGLVVAAVEQLLARNVRPPVLRSMNLDEGDAGNQPLLARYKDRIRGL